MLIFLPQSFWGLKARMGLSGLTVKVLIGSVYSGGIRRKSVPFFAFKSLQRPPVWLGLWLFLLSSKLPKASTVLTLHHSYILFFFFFWLSCLFYRNPWCYIGPTQVIQYNLPILRPADEQSSFPLPFKITPCLSGFVFSFQGLGCGRQHISLPTTPTSTDFSGVPWLALKKENYHLLTMQSIFPYGHG